MKTGSLGRGRGSTGVAAAAWAATRSCSSELAGSGRGRSAGSAVARRGLVRLDAEDPAITLGEVADAVRRGPGRRRAESGRFDPSDRMRPRALRSAGAVDTRPSAARRSRSGRASVGNRNVCWLRDPERGVAVVRAADVVIVVADHVPEHRAELVELHAGHPVRAIAAQADHADLGDVRVIDRRQPADLGHRPGIGRAQLDLDVVLLEHLDLAVVAPQASTLEIDAVMLRRIALGS